MTSFDNDQDGFTIDITDKKAFKYDEEVNQWFSVELSTRLNQIQTFISGLLLNVRYEFFKLCFKW